MPHKQQKKKERGPYKQYLFRDSSAKAIPRNTRVRLGLDHEPKADMGGIKRSRSPEDEQVVVKRNRQATIPQQPPEIDPPPTDPAPSICQDDAENGMFTSSNSDADCDSAFDPDSNYESESGEVLLDDDHDSCDHEYVAEDEEDLFHSIMEELAVETNEGEQDEKEPEGMMEEGEKGEQEEEEEEEESEEVLDEETEEEAEGHDLHFTIQQKIKLSLLLATKKRYNLTYSAAEAIMKLAGVLSNDSSPFVLSKHQMKKAIKSFSSSLSEHHICPSCERYVGIVDDIVKCTECGVECDAISNKKKGNIFLYLSMKDQFTSFFESCLSEEDLIDPNKREKINKYNFEDIFDGKIYKSSVPPGCLSFTFFVDGVQVATTSKKAAWPVLLVLNELPLHLRQRHVFMACLWLGTKKPQMNEYLKPFRDECIELATSGFTYQRKNVHITRQVKALMCVSDSVARPLLRRSTQFNGRFGCGLCSHPGIKMRAGRGTCRSYSIAHQEYPLRTHHELMQHALLAEETGKRQCGIKGVSILASIPDFNMVHNLDLDLFHALVNAAKRFAMLWFDKKFSQKRFSVSRYIVDVNLRLKCITPTCDVSRTPRSLEDRSDWRGHEWYFWVIVYSVPCLKGILPAQYLNHWALLVSALAILMQNSVTRSDVAYADRFLHQFVVDIDRLYGKSNVTFSIHLLTHLKQSVQNFAQPFTHSAFIFESFNSEIKNSVKSSNGAAIQISTNMQLKEAVRRLTFNYSEFMNEDEKKYLESVTTVGKRLATPNDIVGPAHLLGKPKRSVPSPEVVLALKRCGCIHHKGDVLLYDRCILFKEVFHSTGYVKATKQNNSMALLECGQYFEIESFIVVLNDCYALGHFYESDRRKLCDIALPHIQLLKTAHDGTLRAVHVSNIQSKLLSFCVAAGEHTYRIACVNVLKSEMLT